jgi:gliding motility-associated-like protein
MHRKLQSHMKNIITLSRFCKYFAIAFFFLSSYSLDAQTANNQVVVQQCYSGPTISFTNTSGSLLPTVNFPVGTGAGQIPTGYKIADVIVEIQWSKTDDGSCGSITGNLSDMSHVGFQIKDPSNPVRYLAASAATAGFPIIPTVNSFAGTFNPATAGVVNNTTVFRDGYPSLVLPAPVFPNSPAADTVSPNGDPLSFYCGKNPHGNWAIGAIDDIPGAGSPALCVHSYCITIIACKPDTLVASCKVAPNVALSPVGVHTFEFADLDSISDVSCLVKSMTFSPTNANCSNIGTPVAVTMTITDHLDSASSCLSMVNIVDVDPPVITGCFPGTFPWDIRYVDVLGGDTIRASEVTMTDNCGGAITKLLSVGGSPFKPFHDFACAVGLNQFIVQGTDASGNISACTIVVDLRDTIPPTAICGQDTAYVGDGSVNVPAINLDNGSFDVCPPVTGRWINVHLGPDPVYSCADVGSDTVLLIVSDSQGNLDTCNNAVVIVLDTVAPTAICQNISVYLDAAGNAVALATALNNGSIDTCSVDSFNVNGVASMAFNCSHVNAGQPVTLNIFDPSGNTASCVAIVTVLDTIAPTAICRNFTVHLDAGGVATLVADSLNNNSLDLCTGSDLTFEIAGNQTFGFTCGDVGGNIVTLSVLDSFGNANTATCTVIVLDTISPIPNCAIPTAYLNNAGLATLFAADFSAGSSDNCGIVDSFVNVIGLGSTAFTCSAIFTPQSATLIVRDAQGNSASCLATVNVVDTVTPTALCEFSYTATLDAAGNATVVPSDIDSSSTDNCGLVEFTINGASSQTYDCSDIGSLVAILTVRDSSGQTAACPSTITIIDNTPPTASCQIYTAQLSAAGIAAVTPTNVLAFPATSDNCSGILPTFLGGGNLIVYDCDSIGLRTVNIIVTDAQGNTATCQTTVTVEDNILPTASCRPGAFTVELDAAGNGCVTPADVNNSSSDICGIDNMLVNGVDSFCYTCAQIGFTAVTLSVLDASGNLGTCVASIIVDDPIAPVAVCHDTTLYLDGLGVVTALPQDIDAGSSDNCFVNLAINGLPSINYNCLQVGVNSAQLVVSDNSGNATLCAANITVLDTITPIPDCVAPGTVTVFLDNTCFASVPASTFNNTSTDNCGASLDYSEGGFPNATFTAADLATNPNILILTVCDGSNNCINCTTTVIVRDTTPPNMVCQPNTVQLDALGTAIILPAGINNGSNDNCSVPNLTVNGAVFLGVTCANLGSNNVTLIGTDGSGNVDSCQTTVVVEDVSAPFASCNATVDVVLDAVSAGVLLWSEVDLFSSDNCTIGSYVLSQTAFSCGDIATNPHVITMVVTDQSGNTDSCTTTVTVIDTVPPVAICVVAPINLNLVGSTISTTVAAVNASSTDNCAISTITLSQTTFDCSDVGSNIVTLTVMDSSGNIDACAATVNVSDNVDPVAFCQSPTVALDAAGTVTVAATDLALPGSFDNCSLDTILANGLDSVSFTCANLGANIITVFIQDPSSNTDFCAATVTVIDNISPVANCTAALIPLYLDGSGIGVLTTADVDNGSADNCSIVSMTLDQDTFQCIDIATNFNTVNLTVTDVGGNTNSCGANVNVIDTIRPAMLCQPFVVNIHLSSGGLATITADSFDNGTSDACGLASLTFTGAPNPVSCSDLGASVITLIATDVNGNTDSCNTTLTVLDTVPPVLVCNNITVDLDATGTATVDSTTAGLYILTDACGLPSLTLNAGTIVNYTCANLAPAINNITLVATDGSGNTAFCTSIITVQDVTNPIVSCVAGPIQLYLNGVGLAVLTTAAVDAGSTDNCTIVSTTISQDSFTCADVVTNNNPVVLTVSDQTGNFSICNSSVEVIDTIRPTMLCQAATVYLTGVGLAPVAASMFDAGSSDACGIATITFTGAPNPATCTDIGFHVITLIGTDLNGNVDSCATNLTVQDNVSPTLTCSNITVDLDSFGNATVDGSTFGLYTMADACGPLVLTLNGATSVAYSCVDTGLNVINLVVSDGSANAATCSANITIQDVIAPVINCQPSVQYLDVNGQLTVDPTWITASAIDACGIASSSTLPSTMNCTNVSPFNAITLTVVDANGNSSTCNANIEIQDTVPPTMVCADISACLSSGFVSVSVADVDGGTTDACNVSLFNQTINGLPSILYTCDSIGARTIILQMEDTYGNADTCHAIVTVEDCTSPSALCKGSGTNYIAAIASNGFAIVHGIDLDDGSFDICGVDSNSFKLNGFDSLVYNCNFSQLAPDTVIFTVADLSGNIDTCYAIIEIQDNINPTAICGGPLVATVLGSGQAVIAAIALNNGSVDNCSIVSYLINGQTQDTFDCSMLSANLAILTVEDASGNTDTCHAIVNVNDPVSPVVQCVPSGTTFLALDSFGNTFLLPSVLVQSSSDNCGVTDVFGNSQDTLFFNCNTMGNNPVLIVVQDASGNIAQCNTNVNIIDAISPTAVCPSLDTAYLNAVGVATLLAQEIDSASFDNCGITTYLINNQTSENYVCSNIGNFPIATLTVIDATGNSATCTTRIEVLDTIAPIAQCRDIAVYLGSTTGIAIVAANSIDSFSASTENCIGSLALLINGQLSDTFSCTNVGSSNIAILTVTDAYGNSSTCPSNITVIDNTNPSLTCPGSATFHLNGSGVVNVAPQNVAISAADSCSIAAWFISGLPDSTFDCTHAGLGHNVVIRVEDPSGNFRECNTTIQIVDTIPPSSNCNFNVPVLIDSTGVNTVTGLDLNQFNTDNCGITDYLINGQTSITYTCDSVAVSPIVVTLTLVDASGNTSTCQSQLDLQDNINPIMVCNDTVIFQLNQAGIAIAQATALDNGSADNCDIASYSINGLVADTFNCTDAGLFNTAILAVTDQNANSSACFVYVGVEDNLNPVAICQNIDVFLDGAGVATIGHWAINGASTDNCSTINTSFNTGLSSITYGCQDIGVHMVTLIVTDVSGNVDSCVAMVTVRDIIPPTAFCNTLSVDLTTLGPVVLTIVGGGGTIVGAAPIDNCSFDTAYITPSVISCTDVGNIVYTVTAIDASGNIGTCIDTVKVVLAAPIIQLPIQDTTVLCEGDTLFLEAEEPSNGNTYQYEWIGPVGQITTNPLTKDTIVSGVTIANEGYYIFNIIPITGNGCPAADTVYLDVNEVQPPELFGTAPCDGNNTVINLMNDTTYIGSSITYQWYFNGALVPGNNFDSLVLSNMTAADSGTYSMFIQVDEGLTSCTDSSALGFTVDVLDLPIAPVPTVNLPCEGQDLTLFNNAPGFTYSWTGPSGFNSVVPDPILTNATQPFAGTYTLTITDGNNCKNTGTVAVAISPTPGQPNLSYAQPLCLDDLLMLSDADSAGYTFPPILYLWEYTNTAGVTMIDTTSSPDFLLSAAAAADYILTVSMNGCLSSVGDTVSVVYEPIPVGVLDTFSMPFRDSILGSIGGKGDLISNDFPNTSGFIIVIGDTTSNGAVVRNNGDGTIDYIPRSGFFGVDTLYYDLCDPLCPNTCTTVMVMIDVVTDFECFIPQGISPNGDGINDYLNILCSNPYPNAELQVFSRWGTLVYKGEMNGWNGTFQNSDLPDGTYFYFLKLNDTEFTGTGADGSIGRNADEFTGFIMLQR